jgi:uncharacterized protein with PQ loop repeat
MKTLIALTAGLACWMLYGLLIGNSIVALANAVGGSLSAAVLACKIRDHFRIRE